VIEKLVVLRKTSFVDYPGILSAVIFFPGCNLRCPWCHNRELVLGTAGACVTLEEALAHIEKRRKVLGGVVLSGGEPVLFPGIGELTVRIKSLGLKVKIDTNGLRPDVLEKLFDTETTRPDYIAMDLKTSPENYGELLADKTGTANPGEALKRSAELIRASGIVHEFRSLALPKAPLPNGGNVYFGEEDRAALAELAGGSPWRIRPFVPGNCLDPAWDSVEPEP